MKHSLYKDFPSATFDSLVHLIHSGMTQQQRSDLLSALVSLEGEHTQTPGAGATITDSGASTTASECSFSTVVNEISGSSSSSLNPTESTPLNANPTNSTNGSDANSSNC